jgi:hypothetical protein
MTQRRVRLGDILDDYCPRERRVTNHAVVAMIDDEVKQTRCTTCQSDHEYKDAKVPPPRRKKAGALSGDDVVEGVIRPRAAAVGADDVEPSDDADPPSDESLDAPPELVAQADTDPADAGAEPDADVDIDADGPNERDEWPVHRPLIRAQLPRTEGQTPERKDPDFTLGPGGTARPRGFDANRNGKRPRGHRPLRPGQGQPGQNRFGAGAQRQNSGQPPRHGSGQPPRQGSGQGQGQGQRPGNRQGPGGGGRPGQGPGRGPRQGPDPGRKRGR